MKFLNTETTPDEVIVCPLCGGACERDSDLERGEANFDCFDCGFQTSTRVLECPAMVDSFAKGKLKQFVKSAEIHYIGRLPWWPMQMHTEFTAIIPAVIDGKLRWRRYEFEKAPGESNSYIQMKPSAVYKTVKEAITPTRGQNMALGIIQRLGRSITFRSFRQTAEHVGGVAHC